MSKKTSSHIYMAKLFVILYWISVTKQLIEVAIESIPTIYGSSAFIRSSIIIDVYCFHCNFSVSLNSVEKIL